MEGNPMQHTRRQRTFVGLIAVALPLAGCSGRDLPAAHEEHPAHVEHIEGSELSRVTLTERAVERIALETTTLREEQANDSRYKVVPYSSLLYDPQGRTWIYTSPEPRTFVRFEVEVDRIEGDRVLLREGPPVGSVVASVGVAELYGAESGVGQ